MKRTVAYAGTGLLGIFVVIGLLWPWLDDSAKLGVVTAAAVAWAVQVPAFGFLIRYRESSKGFLAVWVGGTLVRFALLLLAVWATVRSSVLEPVPTLLGLAGFLFALLLLEPLFFGREQDRMDTA